MIREKSIQYSYMIPSKVIKNSIIAKPFLKWAGGKSQLIPKMKEVFPKKLLESGRARYIEPFLGGGAVFYFLSQHYELEKSYLFDINKDLVLVYKVVQNQLDDLLEELNFLNEIFFRANEIQREKLFYIRRSLYNSGLDETDYSKFSKFWISRAANMIFLNKTCFNGLYRVNKQGEFNVPFGKYKNPSIVNELNFRAVSKLLENAIIRYGDYKEAYKYTNKNTFLYFDPPYRPLNKTSNFTSYSKSKFNDNNQIELHGFAVKLHEDMKPKIMLSNSDPKNSDEHDDFFDDLYNDSFFNVKRIKANRMINSNGNGRGKITELLITNY